MKGQMNKRYQVTWTGHFDYPDVCVTDTTTGYIVEHVKRTGTLSATIREAQLMADVFNTIAAGKEANVVSERYRDLALPETQYT